MRELSSKVEKLEAQFAKKHTNTESTFASISELYNQLKKQNDSQQMETKAYQESLGDSLAKANKKIESLEGRISNLEVRNPLRQEWSPDKTEKLQALIQTLEKGLND